jgi:antitoxin component YwqK of YwqJK toxin-antitoxin module
MSTEYIWFKNGKESKRSVDPEGKKPLVEKLPDGTKIEYIYHDNLNIKSKTYQKDGIYTRADDLPVAEIYFDNGALRQQLWLSGGRAGSQYHRDGDKPASIQYYKEGGVKSENYYEDGDRHRDGKPAEINYRPSGEKLSDAYFEFSVRIRNPDTGEY